MTAATRLRARGLATSRSQPNAGEGALEQAQHVVLPAPDVVEPRRGQYDARGYGYTSASDAAVFYAAALVVHRRDGTLLRDTGTAFSAYSGTYAAPSGASRPRFARAAGALFFATSTGVKRLDSLTGTPVPAGVPRALDVTPSGYALGTTWLPASASVAYRAVLCRRRSSGAFSVGAPGGRTIYTNTSGGTVATSTIAWLPDDAAAGDVLRLYRSETETAAGVTPPDELFLVYEVTLTAAHISAGAVASIIDNTPEDFLGPPLYTNADTGEGMGQANFPPPMARDACLWQGRMWYADTTQPHRFSLQLIGVGSPDGLQDGDTVTVAGQTYTAKLAASAANDFWIRPLATPAQSVEATARELVRIINLRSATVSAHYVSADTDAPGMVQVEEVGVGGAGFSVQVSRASAWSPRLATAQASDNDRRPAGLCYSKPGEPDAVPPENFLPDVGDPALPILRIAVAREQLYVWKADGVFRVVGRAPGYETPEVDTTVRLVAPDTVCAHNGRLYGLTSQGVVAVSEAGAQVVSLGVEGELLTLLAQAPEALAAEAFAVSYESDRQYLLWLPEDEGDTAAQRVLVYHSAVGGWTEWPRMPREWAALNPSTDVLHLGRPDDFAALQERKGRTRLDYRDDSVAVTLASVSGLTATLSADASAKRGDALEQGTTTVLVESVSEDGLALTLSGALSAGAATLHVAIPCRVRWTSLGGESPGLSKRWTYLYLHFRRYGLLQPPVGHFEGEAGTTPAYQRAEAVVPTVEERDAPWGRLVRPRTRRVLVPPKAAASALLSVGVAVEEAGAFWALHGVSVEAEGTSPRTGR